MSWLEYDWAGFWLALITASGLFAMVATYNVTVAALITGVLVAILLLEKKQK